jgi:hypothetical protein
METVIPGVVFLPYKAELVEHSCTFSTDDSDIDFALE